MVAMACLKNPKCLLALEIGSKLPFLLRFGAPTPPTGSPTHMHSPIILTQNIGRELTAGHHAVPPS